MKITDKMFKSGFAAFMSQPAHCHPSGPGLETMFMRGLEAAMQAAWKPIEEIKLEVGKWYLGKYASSPSYVAFTVEEPHPDFPDFICWTDHGDNFAPGALSVVMQLPEPPKAEEDA